MKNTTYILLLVFSTLVSFAQAQNSAMEKIIKTPPNPPTLVNDYAGILTADQRQALESKLVQFDNSTSTQITVVLVRGLDGLDIADAATELGRSWQVGGKENNNGVVLLVAVDDRKLNISPGYGLEKVLPDLTTQHIIQNVIRPNFKGEDYYRGIDEGTDAIIMASKGEYSAPREYGGKGRISFSKIFFIIIIIIVLLAFSGRGGGGRGGSFMSRRGAMPFILGNILGSGGGGGFGGGGGGGGSGGFGGFGGGSFGGGGSSGSW